MRPDRGVGLIRACVVCVSSVDESHTVVCVCVSPPWAEHPSVRPSRVTIDVTRDGLIREALARRRPVPRGDSWCWIPKPYYYTEVETKVHE